ncbi:Integral membrane protein of the Golgi, partial [Perkinsus olseni]
FFGKEVFNPKFICMQILAMQSCYYLLLVAGVCTLNQLCGLPVAVSRLFRDDNVGFGDTESTIMTTVLVLMSPLMSIVLTYIVERAKKCLDFVVTYHIWHFTSTWIQMGRIPSYFSWWLWHVAAATITVLLGEYLCMQLETREISLGGGNAVLEREEAAARQFGHPKHSADGPLALVRVARPLCEMSALKLSTIGIGLGSTICLWDCYYQEDRASCHSYKDAIKEWWALRGAQCLGFVASKLFYLECRDFAKTQEYMRMLNGKSDGVDADNYENISRVRWMRRGWMLMDKWRDWRNLGLVFDNIDHRYPRAVSHLRRIALVPGGSRLYISCEKNPSSWLYTEPISSRFIQDEEVREYVRAVCACRDENLAMLQGSPRGALDLFDNLIKEKKRLVQARRGGLDDSEVDWSQDIRNCRLFDRERKPVLSKVLRAEIEAHGLHLAAPKRARLMNLTIPHKAGDPEKSIKLDLLFPKLSLLIDTSVVEDEDSKAKFMAMTEERAPVYAPFLFTGSELFPEYIVGINLSDQWRQFVMDPTLGE